MSRRALLAWTLASACGAALPAYGQSFPKEVRVWVHAFIPKTHPSLPDYIKRARNGSWVIEAPGLSFRGIDIGPLAGTCFVTDNREFDSDPRASSRVSVDFVLKFRSRREFEIVAAPGATKQVTIGETHNVDCASGAELRPARRQSEDSASVGSVRTNGFLRIFNVRASSANPFFEVFSIPYSPKIDFDIVFEYDAVRTSLKVKGATGVFPSFEAYYSLPGESGREIVKLAPADGATALNLFDFGTGVNLRNFEKSIDLTGLMTQ